MTQKEFEAEAERMNKVAEASRHPKRARLYREREEFMGKHAPRMTFLQAVRYLAKNKNRALYYDAGWGDPAFPVEDKSKLWSIIFSDETGSDGNEIYAYVSKEVAHTLIAFRCVYSNCYGGFKARKLHEVAPEACVALLKSKLIPLEKERVLYAKLNDAKVGECKNIDEMFERFYEAGFQGYIDTRRPELGRTVHTLFLMGRTNKTQTVMLTANFSARPKRIASLIGMNLHRIKYCLEGKKA